MWIEREEWGFREEGDKAREEDEDVSVVVERWMCCSKGEDG